MSNSTENFFLFVKKNRTISKKFVPQIVVLLKVFKVTALLNILKKHTARFSDICIYNN